MNQRCDTWNELVCQLVADKKRQEGHELGAWKPIPTQLIAGVAGHDSMKQASTMQLLSQLECVEAAREDDGYPEFVSQSLRSPLEPGLRPIAIKVDA